VFVGDLTDRLGALLVRIHDLRPRCRLVVATAVPIGRQPLFAVSAAYADSVRRLAVRLRARHMPVVVADLYSAFVVGAVPGAETAPGLLTSDGIHPTAAGYAVMARSFATAVESLH
jgi:lysophospholipase L1-like esterase